MRTLKYSEALNEGLRQAMEKSQDVVVMGQLVDCKPGVFGITKGLADQFGKDRVLDFPIAESIMTFNALGASLTGIRPVLVHQRVDFAMYSWDALVNWLSLWHFKTNGHSTVPVTICAVVGKGWGQAAQHSKNLHAWFAHLPGFKVAIPCTAHDAKGVLMESIFGETPTLILENRSLFDQTDEVPEEPYRMPFGKAALRRSGNDVTIVAFGATVPLALRAADRLAESQIQAEVIDLITLSPWDRETVCRSVSRTGRLVVADQAWLSFGCAGEIIAATCEQIGTQLKANPVRVCLPDSHTPMSHVLEKAYYIDEDDVCRAVSRAMAV